MHGKEWDESTEISGTNVKAVLKPANNVCQQPKQLVSSVLEYSDIEEIIAKDK